MSSEKKDRLKKGRAGRSSFLGHRAMSSGFGSLHALGRNDGGH